MDIKYKKIHNLSVTPAKKLYNSSYLEYLTGLMEKVSSNINDGTYYFFDDNYYLNSSELEPNNSFKVFIEEFQKAFLYSSSEEIHVIRGRAGIGKTLFFENGIQILTRDSKTYNDKYIPLGVDFTNIDSQKEIVFYEQYIYKKLCENAIRAIRQLKDIDFKRFSEKYNNYCKFHYDTPDEKMFPVMFFCKEIHRQYNKPCIIVLDNVDLASVVTQVNIFKATVNVCRELHRFMKSFDAKNKYSIFFAMRPETYYSHVEARLGKTIDFPLPNIQLICIEIIKNVLIDTALQFDNEYKLKCEVTYYNITNGKKETAKTFLDVAEYFNEIFSHYLINFWDLSDCKERLGSNEEFHCNIANYNVRKFLRFLSDTLSNGGFLPLTKKFNENQFGSYYNVYDYIEMLIRGRWEFHPGNKDIDGEGGNNAPIVFNFFDTAIWNTNQSQQIRHFMLFIRILQFFNMCTNNESAIYEEVKNKLSSFFDENLIMKAMQKLVFVRIIYSFDDGDENLSSIQHWKDVIIKDNTKLQLTPTGKFYLEKFICEFEYLYQMALSSLVPKDYVEELTDCWSTEKELVVLRFLIGIFYILKENLESYSKRGVLEDFKEIFCQDNKYSCKPYRRMLDTFIIVLKNKINRAKKKDIPSLNKLKEILEEAEALQDESTKYFNSVVGGEL